MRSWIGPGQPGAGDSESGFHTPETNSQQRIDYLVILSVCFEVIFGTRISVNFRFRFILVKSEKKGEQRYSLILNKSVLKKILFHMNTISAPLQKYRPLP